MPRNSESCSENGLFSLRERFFSKLVWFPGFWTTFSLPQIFSGRHHFSLHYIILTALPNLHLFNVSLHYIKNSGSKLILRCVTLWSHKNCFHNFKCNNFRLTGRCSSKWHYRQKTILKLILHFVADADTDQNYFGIRVFIADAETGALCSLEGGSIADKNYFGNHFRS